MELDFWHSCWALPSAQGTWSQDLRMAPQLYPTLKQNPPPPPKCDFLQTCKGPTLESQRPWMCDRRLTPANNLDTGQVL